MPVTSWLNDDHRPTGLRRCPRGDDHGARDLGGRTVGRGRAVGDPHRDSIGRAQVVGLGHGSGFDQRTRAVVGISGGGSVGKPPNSGWISRVGRSRTCCGGAVADEQPTPRIDTIASTAAPTCHRTVNLNGRRFGASASDFRRSQAQNRPLSRCLTRRPRCARHCRPSSTCSIRITLATAVLLVSRSICLRRRHPAHYADALESGDGAEDSGIGGRQDLQCLTQPRRGRLLHPGQDQCAVAEGSDDRAIGVGGKRRCVEDHIIEISLEAPRPPRWRGRWPTAARDGAVSDPQAEQRFFDPLPQPH